MKYLVTVPVTAKGTQTFSVKAKTKDEAIEKVRAGKDEFVEEELDINEFKIEHATAEVDE